MESFVPLPYGDAGPEKGYYPLYAQQNLFPFPQALQNPIPEGATPYDRLPLFARQDLNIIFYHFEEIYNTDDINNFVNFQYEGAYGYNGFNVSGSIEVVKQLPEIQRTGSSFDEISIAIERGCDPLDDHLQSSLNMIFSLAPSAKVVLLLTAPSGTTGIKYTLADGSTFTVPNNPFNFLFSQIRRYQSQYDDAIIITNISEYLNFVSPNFYSTYLDGQSSIFSCRSVADAITLPIFYASANTGWRNNGASSTILSKGLFGATITTNFYDPLLFSKNYIFSVGGIVPAPQGSDHLYECFSDTTSGFFPPTVCSRYQRNACQNLVPEYTKQYGVKLPEEYRDSFRVVYGSHLAGPWILTTVKEDKVYGTSAAVILFGIQYAQMKKYYGISFLSGPGNYIEKIFNRQKTENVFTYVNQGIMNIQDYSVNDEVFLRDGNRKGKITAIADPNVLRYDITLDSDAQIIPDVSWCDFYSATNQYVRCDFEAYVDENGIGMNPCGLGYPDWASTGWTQ